MAHFPARYSLALSCALFTALGAAPALAEGRAAAFMEVGRRVAPPRGYIEFCAREPGECPPSMRAGAVGGDRDRMSHYWRVVFEAYEPAALPPGTGLQVGSPATPAEKAHGVSLPASDTLWRDLAEVNQSINRRIAASSDADTYGRSDYWALPLEHRIADGDCEDYVLEKRRALRGRGYADDRLSIALVTTGWGEKHAVLLVQTDSGEVVLDNLSSRISYWSDAPYRWESRQSPDDPAVWVAGPGHGKKVKPRRLG